MPASLRPTNMSAESAVTHVISMRRATMAAPKSSPGEMWGRSWEVQGDVGRCGEVWGGLGRCGEMWRTAGARHEEAAVVAVAVVVEVVGEVLAVRVRRVAVLLGREERGGDHAPHATRAVHLRRVRGRGRGRAGVRARGRGTG